MDLKLLQKHAQTDWSKHTSPSVRLRVYLYVCECVCVLRLDGEWTNQQIFKFQKGFSSLYYDTHVKTVTPALLNLHKTIVNYSIKNDCR